MVPSGSEVQSRTTHGWLIGFFKWLLWLFRRGGETESASDTRYSANGVTSASDPLKVKMEVKKTYQHSSHADAENAIPDSQRFEATGESQTKDKPKPHAGEGSRNPNGEAFQTKHVQAFLERLPEIHRQLLEAETAPGKALAEFMAKLMPIKMELRASLRALRDDYKAMDEMGVHRASQRPKSRVLPAVVLLIFVLVEAVINGSFLAVGIEGGLIGGWLLAAGISCINVVLLGGMLGARSLRWLNHRRLGPKVLGGLFFCCVIILAYSSNLWVAHYRDALLGPDPDNASAAARSVWLAHPVNPLSVNNVESLWLLVLGLVFTTIGIIDGYHLDDPYPGYGRFYIDHTRRQADYQLLFQKSFDELRDVAQKQDSHLADLADEINKRLNDFLLLKARYASKSEDPDFDAWKRIEEGFPEVRVNGVLIDLRDKRGKMLDEYTSAMRDLETLDPTTHGES
jgi:hypothetical protein